MVSFSNRSPASGNLALLFLGALACLIYSLTASPSRPAPRLERWLIYESNSNPLGKIVIRSDTPPTIDAFLQSLIIVREDLPSKPIQPAERDSFQDLDAIRAQILGGYRAVATIRDPTAAMTIQLAAACHREAHAFTPGDNPWIYAKFPGQQPGSAGVLFFGGSLGAPRAEFTPQGYFCRSWDELRVLYDQFTPKAKSMFTVLTVPDADEFVSMDGQYHLVAFRPGDIPLWLRSQASR